MTDTDEIKYVCINLQPTMAIHLQQWQYIIVFAFAFLMIPVHVYNSSKTINTTDIKIIQHNQDYIVFMLKC